MAEAVKDDWWPHQRTLLTGGSGFLGAWIGRALAARGSEVVGIDLAPHFASDRRVDITDADATAEAILDLRPSVIIHLAGISHINQAEGVPFAAATVNVTGTINVMRAAALLKLKTLYAPHVVIASSNHVYGSHPGMTARTEEAPLQQLDVYGASKHCADVIGRSLGLAAHIPTVALRHVNAFGPQNPHRGHITNAAILAALCGEPLILRGDGSARKAYLFASDVADAYLALAKHAADLNVIGRAFNAAPDGEPPSVLEWVVTINQVCLDKGLPVQPPQCRPVGSGEQVGYYERLDAAALRKWTGWAPQTKLYDALAETVAYWQELGA